MAKITIPSLLTFTRSISPSEGLMFGIDKNGRELPVEVITRGIRGSISNYSSVYKKDKMESADNLAKQLDPQNANLQKIQIAYLPMRADKFMLRFSLTIQSNSIASSTCNDKDFHVRLREVSHAYHAAGGYRHLAARYVWNILNSRTLWRNRFCSNKSVKIVTGDGDDLIFNSDNLRLDRFEADSLPDTAKPLIKEFAKALSGERWPLFLNIEITGIMPIGAEVYPSQEFLPEAASSKQKGKILSSVSTTFEGEIINQATMHSQKIGNAIRTIDEWHGQLEEFGTTPIEVFGYVQNMSAATRIGKNAKDFYSLLQNMDEIMSDISSAKSTDAMSGDTHFFMATLVRGGVFSGESKKV